MQNQNGEQSPVWMLACIALSITMLLNMLMFMGKPNNNSLASANFQPLAGIYSNVTTAESLNVSYENKQPLINGHKVRVLGPTYVVEDLNLTLRLLDLETLIVLKKQGEKPALYRRFPAEQGNTTNTSSTK
jgi:hypothetical protein